MDPDQLAKFDVHAWEARYEELRDAAGDAYERSHHDLVDYVRALKLNSEKLEEGADRD